MFFITMKKLINTFDTIIEKSVRLYENPIFKNSIVFIDVLLFCKGKIDSRAEICLRKQNRANEARDNPIAPDRPGRDGTISSA